MVNVKTWRGAIVGRSPTVPSRIGGRSGIPGFVPISPMRMWAVCDNSIAHIQMGTNPGIG